MTISRKVEVSLEDIFWMVVCVVQIYLMFILISN